MSEDPELIAAAERQDDLWRRQEAGETFKNIRLANMHPDYEYRSVPEYGMGKYPVNKVTGEVCEWDGVWLLDGKVLMCRRCRIDGT